MIRLRVDTPALKPKVRRLKELLTELQPGIICVSGGIDSSFLYLMASLWKLDFIGLFFYGPHITEKEKDRALKVLSFTSNEFWVEKVNPLRNVEVKNNTRLRCYYCKKELFGKALNLMYKSKRSFVLDGTNFSDILSFRPGIRALKELGIISPLKEAKLTKKEILELIKGSDFDQTMFISRSCLITRFPYERPIDEKLLKLIGETEDSLMDLGFCDFRLRQVNHGFVIHLHFRELELFKEKIHEVESLLYKKGLVPFKVELLDKVSGYFDRYEV